VCEATAVEEATSPKNKYVYTNLRDARHRVLFNALQRLDSTTKPATQLPPQQAKEL